MISSETFEIPDLCTNQVRQCTECIVPSTACAANFGITCPPATIPTCTCHDICVEEVRLIALAGGTCEFTQCFSYPPIGPCRLGAGITLPIIDTTVQPRVFVLCAQESLDSTTCQVINVQLQLLILASTINSGNILIPLGVNVAFDTFYRFPDCTTLVTGSDLQNALTEIDGSCIVIQLRAQAVPVGTTGTAQITISGKIIDKLWKHENLWITGIRPYDLTEAQRNQGFVSFTIPDVFNNSHTIGECSPLACP